MFLREPEASPATENRSFIEEVVHEPLDETVWLSKLRLLTADQWLAAWLLRRGWLSLAQIKTLGHIQHELHTIGLAYHLEQLLLLFRLVTAEQLQEASSARPC